MEDKVVLVDEKDEELGVMDKEAAHRNGGKLHRASSVMLYRQKNGTVEVLLQRRGKKKKRWPLYWANTVCTDVRPGETYEACAVRRLKEEMGIKIGKEDLKLVFKQIYQAKYDEEFSEYEVEAVFVARYQSAPGKADLIKPDPDEVEEYKWVKWEKINEQGDMAPWLSKMVQDKRLELALGGMELNHMGRFSFDPEATRNRNIENLVGAVQVPVGIAGPLQVKSEKLKVKNYWVPMATTEGALVASVNRGCRAIREAGGCRVEVENVGVTRGPVFKVGNIDEGRELEKWLKVHEDELKAVAEKTSPFLEYKGMEIIRLGKNVWVRWEFNTHEAMGMNMATVATSEMVLVVERETKVKCVALSGNACVDKKPAWMNMIRGRGKKVRAEVVLSKAAVKEVLRTTPQKIVEVVYRKHLLGSVISGALGFNGHFANMVAAVFLATGQDMAQVTEASLGVTTAEMEENGDLYFSIYMPDVMVGTVGGGTHLPTQQEGLKILGLDGGRPGSSEELAGVIGGAVLAGELSLAAALASGDLAKAHERLGRGKR